MPDETPHAPATDEHALTAQRIGIATALFAAWSGTDLDGPRAHLAEEAVLWDSVGGEQAGWPAIRAYFAQGRERYPDLVLLPSGEFWTRPDGLALTWDMSASSGDRRWSVPGMSYLVFDGLTVVHEADYHDQGARERSLR